VVAGIQALGLGHVTLAVAVALWLMASSTTAVSQRVSFRFLPPRASRATMVVVPIVVGAAAISSLASSFSVTTLVCAYAFIDGGTSLLLLSSLRLRRAILFSAVTCAAIVALWTYSLVR
jgi:hypothetical protein